jgi:flagellar biosynthesis regulator FlbT
LGDFGDQWERNCHLKHVNDRKIEREKEFLCLSQSPLSKREKYFMKNMDMISELKLEGIETAFISSAKMIHQTNYKR